MGAELLPRPGGLAEGQGRPRRLDLDGPAPAGRLRLRHRLEHERACLRGGLCGALEGTRHAAPLSRRRTAHSGGDRRRVAGPGCRLGRRDACSGRRGFQYREWRLLHLAQSLAARRRGLRHGAGAALPLLAPAGDGGQGARLGGHGRAPRVAPAPAGGHRAVLAVRGLHLRLRPAPEPGHRQHDQGAAIRLPGLHGHGGHAGRAPAAVSPASASCLEGRRPAE